MRIPLISLLKLLLSLAIVAHSSAQTNISGVITNKKGEALEGVKVSFSESEVITSSEGSFQLSNKSEATNKIVCEKEGFLTTHLSLGASTEASITMVPSAGNVTDVEGNIYQTVQIGNLEWAVQNLRVTRLNDGTPINHVPNDEQWVSDKPSYCYLHNNANFAVRFGALYNWYVIGTGKLAPKGWRVASQEDWSNLEQHLKSNQIAKNLCTQTNDWPEGFPAGTPGNQFMKNNSSGFSAFPSGARGGAKGNFVHLNEDAYWWTSTEQKGKAIRRNIFGAKAILNLATSKKSAGMSVRIVRDTK